VFSVVDQKHSSLYKHTSLLQNPYITKPKCFYCTGACRVFSNEYFDRCFSIFMNLLTALPWKIEVIIISDDQQQQLVITIKRSP
jgi:hypothetical protein